MDLFQKLSQKYREVFPEFFISCPNPNSLRTPIEYLQSKIGGITAPFAPTWLRVSQQLLVAVWF